MRKLQRSLLAGTVALALAAPGSAAAQFSSFYFFGDSLTDAGTYNGARFTINPGLVWAQDIGQQYGVAITPSNQGGTDFAQGGARVTLPSSSIIPGFPQRPVSTQISELLNATPSLNPKALYAVWIGANDIQQNLQAVGSGQITSAQAATNISVAAVQTAQEAARLKAAGARYIIVANLPDLGKTPGGQAGGPAAAAGASQLTGIFNTTLNGAIAQLGLNVIPVNIFGLFNEILANPQSYGFTNTTGVACTTPSALTCTTSTLVSPTAATTYVFADPIHPTPVAHALIAQVVQSMITGPQLMAALAEAPLAVEQANFRALDNRMWSSLNAPRDTRKFQAWAAYDYSHMDLQAGPTNGSGHMNTVAVGLDTKVSDRMLVGAMFGYTDTKGNFGGTGGGYTLRQAVGTAYAGYGEGPWYVGATFGAGDLDYPDIDRAIPLGALVRTESAEARGYELTARILGGYWFTMKDLIHGPYGRLAWTRSVVKPFSEKSFDNTALTYDRQSRDQVLWSLGWQVAGNLSGFRPYARATWEIDSNDPDRTISVSSASSGASYSVPTFKPDSSYALFSLGASTELGGVTGFVAGSATAGRGDSNYWTVTVGLRMPL